MNKRGTLLRWSLLLITLASVVLITYFLDGGVHGQYADDYPYKYSAFDLASGRWNPTWSFSPARTLNYLLVPNLANALPDFEFPARIGIVALQLLNAFLLGTLALRVTSSKWVALLSGAFFLAPVLAQSAILWFTGAVIYLPSLLLMLVGMHLVLSCRSTRNGIFLLVGAVAAWCGMVLFVESGFFILLLVPALVWMQAGVGQKSSFKAVLIAVAVTYLLFIPYVVLALRSAPVVALHGETTFDPIYIITRRIPETIDSLVAHVLDWQPGGILAEALNVGQRRWLSTPAGWGLVLFAVVGSILATFLSPLGEAHMSLTFPGRNARLMLIGLAWIALGLVPVLFIVDLAISSAVMLFPSAGFALALAGLLGWIIERFDRRREAAMRACTLLAAFSILLSSLAMAGLVGVYQMRWERDRQQMAALMSAVPSVPDSPIWVAPIALDERTASLYLGQSSPLNQFLYGLFQIPWAAAPALRMEYKSAQINVVNEDEHGTIHLSGLSLAGSGQVEALSFRGLSGSREVLTSQLLAFSLRANRLILFNRMMITMPDGGKSEVELPLADQLALPQVVLRTWNIKLEGDSQ